MAQAAEGQKLYQQVAATIADAIRAGRYGSPHGQVIKHDFTADVPVDQEGRFEHVRVPLTDAFAQDLMGFYEFELNRPVYLARRVPDPCRFRYRPAGLPSGVKIAAKASKALQPKAKRKPRARVRKTRKAR